MTFSITVPNAAQSPGLFPAQNNTNFSRLKDIINNDHNFTNSAAAAQGIHKQATFINRAAPAGALAAGNGILFASQIDGTSQLSWYNGVKTYQLTPVNAGPIAIVGSVSVTAGSTSPVLITTTGKNYFATMFSQYSNNNSATYEAIFQYGSPPGSSAQKVNMETFGGSERPNSNVSLNSIRVRNNDTVDRTILYYLWISIQ